jgi:HNH endonuclease
MADATWMSPPIFGEDLADAHWAQSLVRRINEHADPGSWTGEQCREMVESLTHLQRLAGAGVALFSPRVVETGDFAKSGHPTAPDWLAAHSGTSTGAAKGLLTAAERASKDERVQAALRQGSLSAPQLSLVTGTETAAPGSAEPLLAMLENGASHQEVSDKAAEMKAAARSKESERAQRQRVINNRHFTWHQDDDGGIRFSGLCDEVQWATVAPIIEAAAKAHWKAAGGESGLSMAAARLDALIDLLGGGGRGARPQVLVIVDAEALKRGTTSTGEICEIDGIGPVPVEAALELLGQGNLQFLVKEGTDIKSVTKSSRDLAQKTAVALRARDRGCVVCGRHQGLQADHCFVDYSDNGPTTLDNLALLCPRHHDMKTYGGWTLIRTKEGAWLWKAPPNPPSAGAIARAKRLAVAKAKGREQRNPPQQD